MLRAGFAGLMIFGGAGLVLFALGWLLIPAQGQEDSIADDLLRALARPAGFVAAAIFVFIAVLIVSPVMTGGGGMLAIEPVVFWSLAVIVIGILLLLGRDRPLGQGYSMPIAADATATASNLLFVGAGLVFLGGSRVGSVSLAWTGPMVAIGLGILIVIAVRPRSNRRADDDAPEDEPA